MKRPSYPCLGALACAFTNTWAFGQAIPLWAHQFGSYRDDVPAALVADGDGGVFLVGSTNGALGGPNAGSSMSFWPHDAFLCRYDSSGQQLWVRQFGTPPDDFTTAAAPDGKGGLYIVGNTRGSLGGPHAGRIDVFVARHDSAGDQLWVRQLGTSDDDYAAAVVTDGAGGAFLAGSTLQALSGPHAGDDDMYVVRYDGSGARVWIRQFGTPAFENSTALCADGAGGVFVGGRMNPGGTAPQLAVLARYDAAGDQAWLRYFNMNEVYALAPDDAGGVFMASQLTLSRHDGNGEPTWLVNFGSGSVTAMTPDGQGGFILGGRTVGAVFGPSAGGVDVYAARFTGVGARIWAAQFGSSASDSGGQVASDGAGGVLVSGWTYGEVFGQNAGLNDALLAHYRAGCYPDCNQDAALNLADFGCFQTKFGLGDLYADCNEDGARNLADFGCFQTRFALGCP